MSKYGDVSVQTLGTEEGLTKNTPRTQRHLNLIDYSFFFLRRQFIDEGKIKIFQPEGFE